MYADDYDATIASFDDATKAQVTRADLGDLSDRMRALGAYQGLSQTNAQPDLGKYEYDLQFAKGHMTAELRVDPSGKIGAYRVIPAAPPRASPSPAA